MEFEEFKQPFIDFMRLFNPCPEFKEALNNCESYSQLRHQIYKFSDDIAENLNGKSFIDLEDDIDDLEYEVSELKGIISELEEKLNNSLAIEPNDLDDIFKRDFIIEYHKQYTPWEIELLLKNGKKYLNNI